MTPPKNIVVCLKWTPADPSRASSSSTDERFTEISAADQAALELALCSAEAAGDRVVVITAGPPPADKILREALACGAVRAMRVDIGSGVDGQIASADSAAAVARVVQTLGDVRLIWCGDYSSDRGSGSFPAFLAAHLGLEQALGLIRVDFPATNALPLDVIRRLDGGRRERSIVRAAAVLSVEGSVARLRRASLSASLSAQSRPIDIVETSADDTLEIEPTVLRPYRPRARSIPAPSGTTPLDRIRSVTETSAPKGSSDPIALDAPQAAALILQRLREWGYVQ